MMSWKVSGLESVDSEEDEAAAAISNSSRSFGVGVVVGTKVHSLHGKIIKERKHFRSCVSQDNKCENL